MNYPTCISYKVFRNIFIVKIFIFFVCASLYAEGSGDDYLKFEMINDNLANGWHIGFDDGLSFGLLVEGAYHNWGGRLEFLGITSTYEKERRVDELWFTIFYRIHFFKNKRFSWSFTPGIGGLVGGNLGGEFPQELVHSLFHFVYRPSVYEPYFFAFQGEGVSELSYAFPVGIDGLSLFLFSHQRFVFETANHMAFFGDAGLGLSSGAHSFSVALQGRYHHTYNSNYAGSVARKHRDGFAVETFGRAGPVFLKQNINLSEPGSFGSFGIVIAKGEKRDFLRRDFVFDFYLTLPFLGFLTKNTIYPFEIPLGLLLTVGSTFFYSNINYLTEPYVLGQEITVGVEASPLIETEYGTLNPFVTLEGGIARKERYISKVPFFQYDLLRPMVATDFGLRWLGLDLFNDGSVYGLSLNGRLAVPLARNVIFPDESNSTFKPTFSVHLGFSIALDM